MSMMTDLATATTPSTHGPCRPPRDDSTWGEPSVRGLSQHVQRKHALAYAVPYLSASDHACASVHENLCSAHTLSLAERVSNPRAAAFNSADSRFIHLLSLLCLCVAIVNFLTSRCIIIYSKSSMEQQQHADGQQQQLASGSGSCLCCHRAELEYQCVPCNHATFCKACAMKMATGGKCKVCHQLFAELRRIRSVGVDHSPQ